MSTTVETNVVRIETAGQGSAPAENPTHTVLQAAVDELAAKNAWRKSWLTCKASTDVMLVNIGHGAEALLKPEIQARLAKSLPDFDLERLRGAVRLAQAVNFLDHRVDANRPSMKKGTEDLILGRKLRDQFATVVRMAVAFDYIPETATKDMFKGNSKGNIAHDIDNCIHLLQTHEGKLEGVTPVTPELMSRGEALAGRLLVSRDIGSPLARRDEEVAEQIRTRDLLYTDLVELHEQMRKAAFWLWGKEMNKYVPALRSAKKAKSAKPAAEERKAAQPGQVTAPVATPAQPSAVLPFTAHSGGTSGAQTVPASLTIEQPGTLTPKLIVA